MAKGEAPAEAASPAAKVATPAVVEEMPMAIVRRLVKDKLAGLAPGEDEVTIHKDAMLAFAESSRVFIHYLSATANDICKESKRQTMNAEDVLKAIEEIEFPEFIGPLKAALEEFRKKNVAKRSGTKTKETNKKRKTAELTMETEKDGAEGADEEDRGDEGDEPEDQE